MAISRVQVKAGGGDGHQGTSISTGNFPGSCTAGNYIIVVTRTDTGFSAPFVTGITDTLGTSYAAADVRIVDVPAVMRMEIWHGKLASSGTNAVLVDWGVGADTNYAWVYAIEVAGLAASSVLDQVDSKANTGVTDMVSNPITTTQASEYIVMGASQANFAAYSLGASFTALVDGTIPTNANDFGGVQEFITSSIQSAFTCHITSSVSDAGVVVVATFKGAGANPRFFILTHPA